MKINYIESNAKLFTSQRRTPSKYNLTKLTSDSLFLKTVFFKILPGSKIISRIVHIFVFSGNVISVYVKMNSLYHLKGAKFKEIFNAFAQSMFLLCFLFISSGPFSINLDHFHENFDSIWSRVIITQGTICETLIASELKKINRELIIMLLSGTTLLIGFVFITTLNQDTIWFIVLTNVVVLYTVYLTIGYIYILRLSVCLIKSCYKSIESRLEACSLTLANLGQIRLCRQSHNQMIKLTDLLQNTFKHVFSSVICIFVPQFVLGFYQVATTSQPIIINAFIIGWNCVNFYAVLNLAEGLILLNALPQSYYLALYLASFGDINDLVKIEINHYLSYVASKDVGFRLWGNFLVDNQLIPKLCAVLFSYLTAGVSFLQ